MAEEDNTTRDEGQQGEAQQGDTYDPAIAPSLTAGLGAVYLRNKLKAVQTD